MSLPKRAYERPVLTTRLRVHRDFVSEYYTEITTLKGLGHSCKHCFIVVCSKKSCEKHALGHCQYYESDIAEHFSDINNAGMVHCKKCGQEMAMQFTQKHHNSGKCRRNARNYVPEEDNHPNLDFAEGNQGPLGNIIDQEANGEMEVEEDLHVGHSQAINENLLGQEEPPLRPQNFLDPKGLARRYANEFNLLAQKRVAQGDHGFKEHIRGILEQVFEDLKKRYDMREEDYKKLWAEVRKLLLNKEEQMKVQDQKIAELTEEVRKAVKKEDLERHFSELFDRRTNVINNEQPTAPPSPR